MLKLQGRVAVVTGGASGIGAACVALLSENGVLPVTWDLAEESDVRCDVTNEVSVNAAIKATREKFGSPSLLVACAGIVDGTAIQDMTVAKWDRVFAVNMRGVMLSVQAVAREIMAVGGDGSMVLISSVNSVVADPGLSAYSASKAAVSQFARVAAREFGPYGIRVNSVGPGPTDTPMLSDLMKRPEYREELVQRSALRAIGSPLFVAEAVVSLLQLEWVTGQALMVDGGSSLNTGRTNWQRPELNAP